MLANISWAFSSELLNRRVALSRDSSRLNKYLIPDTNIKNYILLQEVKDVEVSQCKYFITLLLVVSDLEVALMLWLNLSSEKA